MIRAVASFAVVVVLLGLAGCGGGDARNVTTGAPPAASTGASTSTEPASPPSYTSTAGPGVLDGCALIPVAALTEHFGGHPQIIQNAASLFEDPQALDCAWRGLDMSAKASVTSHAGQYMSREGFEADFADIEEAQDIEGADWGWAYGSTERGVYFFVLVKNDVGVSFNITVDNTEHEVDDVLAFADDLLASLAATSA